MLNRPGNALAPRKGLRELFIGVIVISASCIRLPVWARPLSKDVGSPCYRTSRNEQRSRKTSSTHVARLVASAEGVDEITLTHYADEKAFRAMKLPEQGDDFEYGKLVNAEVAKVMVAHGFQLKVQVLDAKEYFEWLGGRQNTYQAQQEYPGGQHVSGDQALTLLGIK